MDIEVVKSFTKAGGAVGSVLLILYLVVDNLFKEPVYQFLGSEKLFILILVVFGLLFTAIILKLSKSDSSVSNPSNNSPTVNYRDSSTHNGDNRF